MTPSNRRVERAPSDSESDIPPAAAPQRSAKPGFFSIFRTVVGVTLIASTSTGAAWALHNHVMQSPRFAITTIDVMGNERRPAADIVSESGLTVGTNIFAADLDRARTRILADAWMMDVSLLRRLPGTVEVRVTEHKAAALVSLDDTFLASADGEPFKKLDENDPFDLPLVTGLRPESLAEDHDGTVRTIRRGIDLAAEFGRSELAKRNPLEEVHVGPDGAFTLVVGRSAVELVLGGPPFRRKLDEAARIVGELDRRGAKADVVMLDNDARPDRVVVRMR